MEVLYSTVLSDLPHFADRFTSNSVPRLALLWATSGGQTRQANQLIHDALTLIKTTGIISVRFTMRAMAARRRLLRSSLNFKPRLTFWGTL